MAKRQFMSKRFPRRNPLPKSGPSPRGKAEASDPDGPVDTGLFSSPLIAAIETERVRLLEAQCVLHCLYVALMYDEGDPLEYADAAKVSGRLVSKALDQLDSARLQPLIADHRARDRR